ncbi:uncharacterized protein [Aegilops tauschii subsp. strangulata]|uniref:uncharacterized protein n=1 Tax=Aegilops tauschii subsp. strangulata TaxID=200361 RepID=UPI001ABC0D83|nr:uncharacterized protein LOC120969120 [Aegilops tauschii subsp. strangulata]
MTGAGQGKDTTTFVFAEMQLLRDLDGEMEEFAAEDTGEVLVDVSEKTRAEVIDNLPDDIMPDFSNFGVTDKSQVAGKETGKIGKKQKTYGPVQASRKSSREDISQPMVDRAVLLKMKQNLELPKSMKGDGDGVQVSKGLDKTISRTAIGRGKGLSGLAVGDSESTVCPGAGLNNCKSWLGHLSWREATRIATHGGHTTLAYKMKHPEEANSIQVVFSGLRLVYCLVRKWQSAPSGVVS